MSDASRPAPGILAIWTDIAPELEAEFNEWHCREHLPERLAVPGFRRARRYQALAGAPRHFVWYELDAVEILASPAYLERLDNPTEWTSRMMPGFRNTTRATFRATRFGDATGGLMLTLRSGEQGQNPPEPALLRRLGGEPGVLRVQLWQPAALAAPPSREAALRGSADRGAEWAVTVEAAAEETLDAAAQRLRGALPGADRVALYRFGCGMEAPDRG
jgi:hypothetical protein